MKTLLLPHEVDDLLRYPDGRAERLAKRGIIPAIKLPDGQIRFDKSVIEQLIEVKQPPAREVVTCA